MRREVSYALAIIFFCFGQSVGVPALGVVAVDDWVY